MAGTKYFSLENRDLSDVTSFAGGLNLKKLDALTEKIGFDTNAIISAIKTVSSLQKAIDGCWQGQARDAFLLDLDNSITTLIQMINNEYYDLMSRFQEAATQAYTQDKKMYR